MKEVVSTIIVQSSSNAYERIRAYYLNCAETLAGGKR